MDFKTVSADALVASWLPIRNLSGDYSSADAFAEGSLGFLPGFFRTGADVSGMAFFWASLALSGRSMCSLMALIVCADDVISLVQCFEGHLQVALGGSRRSWPCR